jgi:hypothetical protein
VSSQEGQRDIVSSLSQAVRIRTPPGEALRIVCHVAVMDHRANRVGAAITPAGWLLPTAIFAPRTTQKTIIARACAALPVTAVPRCLGLAHIDRVSESIDYLFVADIGQHHARESADAVHTIDWSLLSAHPALVPYQETALRRLATANDPRDVALQPSWLHRVTSWVTHALDLQRPGPGPLCATDIYRADEQRIVAAIEIGGRLIHFKTSTSQPFVEAEVTRIVATANRAWVPPTLAFDVTRGWWLTDHVEGVPLTGAHWPEHLTAVETWGALQRALRSGHEALRSVGVMTLDRQLLVNAARHAVSAVEGVSPQGRVATEAMARVDRLLATPTYDAAPEGLLHFDAAPRNILQTAHGSVFLDLEAACLGPAIICGELMARRMKDELSIAQRNELSAHAAAMSLRDAGLHVTPSAEHVRALTDLCLLAYHSRTILSETPGALDLPSAQYGWARVSADFLNRTTGWRI